MKQESADGDICARLAMDDPSALETIWDCYAADLLGYLTALLCSRHEAEDALQDVFVAIACKRQAVAKARCLKAYLFRLARNTGLNRLKRTRHMQRQAVESSCWLAPEQDGACDEQTSRKLASALAALPEKQRVVLVLKLFRGKTFREIGQRMGTSENTAASRYRYAVAALRTLIRKPEP